VVTNRKEKDPLTVRVSFDEEAGRPPEVWELTLQEPGSEVSMDVLGRYARETGFNSGEGPLCAMFLVVLKGQGTVKVGRQPFRAPWDQPSIGSWDNKVPGVRGPLPIDPKNMWPWDTKFANTQPAAETHQALKELVLRLGSRPVEVLLEESLLSEKPA